ncbi:MAG: hypothetical protein ABIZ05_01480 [Pseudonocardiaceae bacterium]
MNNDVPRVIALYREDEDGGEDQPAGWAMVLPETEKVVRLCLREHRCR